MLWEDNYLAHYGIKGQKWGVRRFQNEDGTYTPAGRERYGLELAKKQSVSDLESEFKKLGRKMNVERILNKSNSQQIETIDKRWDIVKKIDQMEQGNTFETTPKDFVSQAKQYNNNSMQDQVKIGNHLRKLKPIVDAAEDLKPEADRLRNLEKKESKIYSDLYKNRALLDEISDAAYKEFSKSYKDDYSEEEMREDREFWDRHVNRASQNGGRYYESYIGDSILSAYYNSPKGKEYKKVVDSFVDAYRDLIQKTEQKANSFLGKDGKTVVRKDPYGKKWNHTASDEFAKMTFDIMNVPKLSSVCADGIPLGDKFLDKAVLLGLY